MKPYNTTRSRAFSDIVAALGVGEVLTLALADAPPDGTIRTIARKLDIHLKRFSAPTVGKFVIFRFK